MKDRPLCSHGDHDDGSKWCDDAKEALIARLSLIRIRLGADFETHGGKKVMYVGHVGWDWPVVPYGDIGTVESTTEKYVNVQWPRSRDGVIPRPMYMHSWKEVEVLKTDDDGNLLPGEVDRARLKIAPRILELALPCPICGSRKFAFSEEYGYRHMFCTGDYGTTCDAPRPEHCGAGGPLISDQFPELMVIAVWNIRGVPGALTKEIRGFPKGDVEVIPTLKTVDVPESPCPWCLGTRIKIGRDPGSTMFHGHCAWCGGHGPWWPGIREHAKNAEDVVRLWKKRP